MRYSQTSGIVAPASGPPTIEQESAKRRRGFLAWLAPDLAMVFAVVTLLCMFFKFGGATDLFGDSDTGWHIRTGERILSTGSLPHADPFSFSKPGEPWVAWEWGADVLMGSIHRVSGLAGVALLYGLLIGAAVWMWFRLNRAAEGNILLAGMFFFIMLPVTSIHWLARPHIFSWLFLVGTVWLCEQLPHRVGWRQFTLVALATAAWANLHASFFFAPLIFLIYAAGAYLKPLIWQSLPSGSVLADVSRPPMQESWRRRGMSYVLFAVAAGVGTLANPNGWQLHQHLFSYLFNSGMLNRIQEFQSFDFHSGGSVLVMLMLAICFAGGFGALAIQKPERFLLSMMLIFVALRSVRALPVAALLLLPLASGSITAVLSRAGDLTPWLRRKLDDTLGYGERLDVIDRQLGGFAFVPLIAVLIFVSIRTSAGFPPGKLPVAASAIVASLPASARILAPDTFGGYLIYRFNGDRKVFDDGRSDFYGPDFVERCLGLIRLQPGWTDEFNRWNFNYALLPPDYSLVGALEARGWREIYRDKTAVLLTGKSRL